jgi:hypothetical protein
MNLKKIFLVILISTVFPMSLFAQEPEFSDIDSINVEVKSISFNEQTGNIEIVSNVKNQRDFFIGNLKYSALAYNGEEIQRNGPAYELLEFIFAAEDDAGELYPNEEKEFTATFSPPKGIDTGKYFFDFSIYEKTHSHIGVGYNEIPVYLNGDGSFLGSLKNSLFRTNGVDNEPLWGEKISVTDPASIIIPLADNKKIAEYAEKNDLYANVIFSSVADPEKIIRKYEKEKLQIITENGKKIIKYDIIPWENVDPAPYNIEFGLVDKDRGIISETEYYRWWIDGAYARLDTIYSPFNFYKKGQMLDISVSVTSYDSDDTHSNERKANLLIDIVSVDEKIISFGKEISLSHDNTEEVNFNDEKFISDIKIKTIKAALVDEDGEILDETILNFDTDNIFSPKEIKFSITKIWFFVLLCLFFVALYFSFIFRKNKKIFTLLLILAICLLAVSLLFHTKNKAEAATTYFQTFSYNGSTLIFKTYCSACFNNSRTTVIIDDVPKWSSIYTGTGKGPGTLTFNYPGCKAEVKVTAGSHCGSETKSSGNVCPINGSCGSTYKACSSGRLGSYAEYQSENHWWCNGTNGGSNVLCKETRNGACGSTYKACSSGKLGGYAEYPTTAYPNLYAYHWWCNGSSFNGTNILCQINKTKIDGVCGSASGKGTSTKPASNLCTTGEPTTVTGSGPWNWTCSGSNGGSSQSCSAPVLITPSCGTTLSTSYTTTQPTGLAACSSGSTFQDATDATDKWKWNCLGNNNNSVSCSNNILIGPKCGYANNTNVYVQPTDLAACANGTYSDGLPETDLLFNWSCGNDPSTKVNCSANRKINGACGTGNGLNYLVQPTLTAACNPGTYDPQPTDSNEQFLWSCLGINEGLSVNNCYANKTINAKCGTADETTISSLPTGVAACNPGIYDKGEDDTGTLYKWNCLGISGGSPDNNCWANKTLTLGCGTAAGTNVYNHPNSFSFACAEGNSFDDLDDDDDLIFKWKCTYNSSSKICTANKKINADCKSSINGRVITQEPTTNSGACDVGTLNASVPDDTEEEYHWTCEGINDGADKTCYALKNPEGPCDYSEISSYSIPNPIVASNKTCDIDWTLIAGNTNGSCVVKNSAGVQVGVRDYTKDSGENKFTVGVNPSNTYSITCRDICLPELETKISNLKCSLNPVVVEQ